MRDINGLNILNGVNEFQWNYHPDSYCAGFVVYHRNLIFPVNRGNRKETLNQLYSHDSMTSSLCILQIPLQFYIFFGINDIHKTAWNRSYCIYHLWNNKCSHWASAVLCADRIRSKISQYDQGRDRVRFKDLRLHLPMNIWCLSEARASDPLSGRGGVRGNLPYLHLATFQQFLMWMRRHIPAVPKSYAAAVCIKWKLLFSSEINVCLLFFFSSVLPAWKSKYRKLYILHSKSRPYFILWDCQYQQIVNNCLAQTSFEGFSAQLKCWLQSANENQELAVEQLIEANKVVKWPQSYFDMGAAMKKNSFPWTLKTKALPLETENIWV